MRGLATSIGGHLRLRTGTLCSAWVVAAACSAAALASSASASPPAPWGAIATLDGTQAPSDGSAASPPWVETAVGGSGGTVTAWVKQESGGADGRVCGVYARHRPAGGDWQATDRLGLSGPCMGMSLVQVAMTPEGTAVAAWLEKRLNDEGAVTDGRVLVAEMSADGDWGAPQEVATANTTDLLWGVRLAMNADGEAVLAWVHSLYESGSDGSEIRAAVRAANGSWSAPDVVDTLAGSLARHEVGIDGSGNATVAWSDDGPQSVRIRPAGGPWGSIHTFPAPYALGGGQPDLKPLPLAVADNGETVLGLLRYQGIAATRRAPSGTWTDPVVLEEGTDKGFSVADAAIASNGKATLTWVVSENLAPAIQAKASRGDSTGSWSSPHTLGELNGCACAPRVAVDEAGNAVAAWHSPSTRFLAAFNRDEEWQAPAEIDNYGVSWNGIGGGEAVQSAAMNATGDAAVAWSIPKTASGTEFEIRASVAPNDLVAINGGPSSRTRSVSASFDLSTTAPDPEFECRLDDQAWQPCTAQPSYQNLGEGDHTFRARLKRDDDSGSVSERKWTIDRTGPEVTIGALHSGARTATIEFSSEAGAHFVCSLDGGPFEPCASPAVFGGLAIGRHTIAIRATDSLGNDGSPTSREFDVAEDDVCPVARRALPDGARPKDCPEPPAPPVPDCPGGVAKAQSGAVIAVARSELACFKERGDTLVSPGPVEINGMLFQLPNGEVRIDRGDAKLRITRASEMSIRKSPINWPMAPFELATGKGATTKFSLPFAAPGQLGGLFIAAAPQLTLSRADGGSATGEVFIKIPKVPLATMGAAISTSNDKGLSSAVLSLERKTKLPFAGGAITNLAGSFDLIKRALKVKGAWELPGAHAVKPGLAAPEVELSLEARHPFSVSSVSVAVQKLNVPLTAGFFLQRFGISGDIGEGDATVAGEAGASFGPFVSVENDQLGREGETLFEGAPLGIDGKASVNFPTTAKGGHWTFRIDGQGTVFNTPFSSLAVQYKGGLIEVFGGVGIKLPYGEKALVTAGVQDAWIDRDRALNIEARVDYDVLAFKGKVKGIWSARKKKRPTARGLLPLDYQVGGAIVCYEPADQPGKSFPIIARNELGQPFGFEEGGCDTRLIRVKKTTAAAQRLRSAQAVPVPAKLPFTTFAVYGDGAAPRVDLIGPDGSRFSTTDEPAQRSGQFLSYSDSDSGLTYIVVFSPAAGEWTVAPQAGSVAIKSISQASGLPAPSVQAKVSPPRRGRRGPHTLTYKLKPIDGQVVRFVERGADVAREIGTARRATGTIRFTPAPGAERRDIVAIVEQDENPRTTLTAGSYLARGFAAPARPGKVTTRVRGRRLDINWRAAAGAASYQVLVDHKDGRSEFYEPAASRRRLRISGLVANAKGTVRVLAVDERGVSGPAARATFPPKGKKKR